MNHSLRFSLLISFLLITQTSGDFLFPTSNENEDVSVNAENVQVDKFEPRQAVSDSLEDFGTPSEEETMTDDKDDVNDLLIDAEQIRDHIALDPSAILEYESTMHDFSQAFLTQAWFESDNLVFSPFSLHSTLSLLASGATLNSTTYDELLNALGRVRNIQALELRYQALVRDYKNTKVKDLLQFGNTLWTSDKYYNKTGGRFLEKVSSIYAAELRLLQKDNPQNEINQWVRDLTKGKIDGIIGELKQYRNDSTEPKIS